MSVWQQGWAATGLLLGGVLLHVGRSITLAVIEVLESSHVAAGARGLVQPRIV